MTFADMQATMTIQDKGFKTVTVHTTKTTMTFKSQDSKEIMVVVTMFAMNGWKVVSGQRGTRNADGNITCKMRMPVNN